jgi:nucleoside-diphosphate-sugar epimerase
MREMNLRHSNFSNTQTESHATHSQEGDCLLSNGPYVEGKTILITGGAGFIGASLAERLCESNTVILFDRTFDEMPLQYSAFKDSANIERIQGDVLDSAAVARQVRRAEIVIHLAAIVGVNRVRQNARQTIDVNFIGTSNALRATEGHGHLTRFVYFSTSEIFGTNSFRADEGDTASIGPVSEARWSYSIAKLAGEHLVTAYHKELGIPTTIVRPFNIFGPKRTGEHALSRFILNALQDRELEVHGDGSQIRSWCYIDDFCDGVLRTLCRDEAIGQDFNIGSTRNTLTIYELAKRVVQLTGSKSNIIFTHQDFSDIDVRVPRLDKARRLLGYEARYELEEALELTIDWYRQFVSVAGAYAGSA